MSDHIVSPKIYFIIFLTLLFFTALTVWVAFFDLGFLNNVVALTIAVIKATLVVLFFMHVKYSSRLTRVFAIAGIFWLIILLSYTLSDVMTRTWTPQPEGWSKVVTSPLPE